MMSNEDFLVRARPAWHQGLIDGTLCLPRFALVARPRQYRIYFQCGEARLTAVDARYWPLRL